MISKLPRLLFRTLSSVRFAAGAAGSSIPQIPWAPPELGLRSLFSGAVMAAQGSSPLRADSQRLEAKEEEEEEEAERGGMGGKVQPPTASKQLSQQIGEEEIMNASSGPKAKRGASGRPTLLFNFSFLNVGGGGGGDTSIFLPPTVWQWQIMKPPFLV